MSAQVFGSLPPGPNAAESLHDHRPWPLLVLGTLQLLKLRVLKKQKTRRKCVPFIVVFAAALPHLSFDNGFQENQEKTRCRPTQAEFARGLYFRSAKLSFNLGNWTRGGFLRLQPSRTCVMRGVNLLNRVLTKREESNL